jgi:hypothetical protein
MVPKIEDETQKKVIKLLLAYLYKELNKNEDLNMKIK